MPGLREDLFSRTAWQAGNPDGKRVRHHADAVGRHGEPVFEVSGDAVGYGEEPVGLQHP